MPEFRCDTWEAVHDRVPGRDGALAVTAVCHAPQPGWSFQLHRSEAQEDPRELRLRLEVERPQGGPDQRTDVYVEFVTYTDDDVETVTVEGIADRIPVKVVA